tara:strand:- start:425 stop:826 length:402 start_codon:yes stop_codon:yes gene_type:complete
MQKILEVNAKKKIKVNIIPLIDIIFLMLVFFMLATNFEKNKQIDLAVSKDGKSENKPNLTLKIVIKNDGNFFIDEESFMKSEVETKILELWNTTKYKEIFILNEKQSIVQDLVYLIDLLKNNNIEKIYFDNKP